MTLCCIASAALLVSGPVRADTGTLVIETTPPARCSVGSDLQLVRRDSHRLLLPPGPHRVRCSLQGAALTRTIEVKVGETATTTFEWPGLKKPKGPQMTVRYVPKRRRTIVEVVTDKPAKCSLGLKRFPRSGRLKAKPGSYRLFCRWGAETAGRDIEVPGPVAADSGAPKIRSPKGTKLGTLHIAAKLWAKCSIDGGPRKISGLPVKLREGYYGIHCTQGHRNLRRIVKVKAGKVSVPVFVMDGWTPREQRGWWWRVKSNGRSLFWTPRLR